MDRANKPPDNTAVEPSQLSLFVHSPDAVCLLDSDARILALNPVGTSLFHTPNKPELPQDSLAACVLDLEALWSSRHNEDAREQTMPWVREEGATSWWHWSISPAPEQQWLLVGRDVTKKIEDRRRLQTERDRLASFLDNAADGFFIHDMEGRILDANRAACAMLGYTREELLQITVSDMDPSIERRKLGGIWKRIQPGQPFSVESTNVRKDGSTFPIEARGGLFGPPDNLLMMTMTRDIRDRKRAENAHKKLLTELRHARDAALQANQFKSSFLANMSHELRTPLNAILGYTELLVEEFEDEGMTAYSSDAQKIHQAGKKLLSLVNDVLDLSKIEAGKMELHVQEFPARMFVEELVALMTPMFDKSGNTLHIRHPATLDTLVADRARLSQSLLNLLSNANKFTTKGDITLTLQQREEGGEIWQVFRVQDTGVGIPASRLDSLFIPFAQADRSIWQTYGGTGLGLTISQQFCRLMGGDIRAESREGEGSCFTIEIPLTPPLPKAPEWPKDEEAETTPTAAFEDMLLVIDHDTSRHEELLGHFALLPLQVRGALTSQEGIKYARVYVPNFVLLDMRLPNDEGWAVLQHFMIDPLLSHVTLIVCTTPRLKERCLVAGATAYLPQHYEPHMLQALLQEHGFVIDKQRNKTHDPTSAERPSP